MSSPERKHALIIGLILADARIPAWFSHVLETIAQDGYAEVQHVLLLGKENRDTVGQPILYSILDRIDRIIFSRGCDPLRRQDLPQGLHGKMRKIDLHPAEDANPRVAEQDLKEIKKCGLDLLIAVEVNPIPPEISDLTRFGVLTLHFGADTETARQMPGLREVMEKQSVTQTFLAAQGGIQPLPEAIGAGTWFTHPLSPARHRSYYFWAAAALLPRALQHLQSQGYGNFVRAVTGAATLPRRSSATHRQYGNLQVIRSYLRLLGRDLAAGFSKLFMHDKWLLLAGTDRSDHPNFHKFSVLAPPRGSYWADPCLVETNSTPYIFLEVFDARTKKGNLAVMAGRADGSWHLPQTVLEKPYHLSYPFVFEVDSKFYLVPESAGVGRIDLFRCVQFPLRWEFDHTLINNIQARDTTLFFHDGTWWLFTAAAPTKAQGANVELDLFFTKDFLRGDWEAHPQNPVCSDIRQARPAGAIFSRFGKLYRPSQDCSGGYGSGIDIHEIELLTREGYRERLVTSIRPTWDARVRGMHTLSRSNRLCVVDALVRTSIFQRNWTAPWDSRLRISARNEIPGR